MKNQEAYLRILERRQAALNTWRKIFPLKDSEVTGKIIITSFQDGESMYQTLWNNSDTDNPGLKRYFIPAIKWRVADYDQKMKGDNDEPI